MPLYEYQCPRCGVFTAWAAMSASAQPAACPVCAGESVRVLSATNLRGTRAQRPRRGRPEPRLVKRDGAPPPPAKHVHGGGHRPWMMGH